MEMIRYTFLSNENIGTDMSNIKDISAQTIENLNSLNIEANPKEYASEFCNVVSKLSLSNTQCEVFANALLSLSQEELDSKKEDELVSVYDIVEILLKRPSSSELKQQTTDVAKIISLMDKHLSQAIEGGEKAHTNIDTIKQKITKADSFESMEELRVKLIKVSTSVENEIDKVNIKLKEGKVEVSLLEKKLKELEQQLNKYKKESTVDHLTGLVTRRSYDTEVLKFEDTYIRDKQDYAIVFFDLDHFKNVNDTYGHDCGDVVLKTFGAILNKLTRRTDIIARYGGEEFVAAIKYKNEQELIKYLKRVKDIVTSNKFAYKDLKLSITFSAGVDIRSSHKNYTDTIQQSDILVYEAKENGRNQIVFGSGTII